MSALARTAGVAGVARRPAGGVRAAYRTERLALTLVVPGFAGSWGLPLMAAVLAGDLFAAEVRHGPWKTVLTRSCTRRHLFAGTLLAVALFALALLALQTLSSLAAGLLQTPVTYDVTVQSNRCYKAESPPSFVGQQTMRDANGRTVVNPLFTIYGCFNPL